MPRTLDIQSQAWPHMTSKFSFTTVCSEDAHIYRNVFPCSDEGSNAVTRTFIRSLICLFVCFFFLLSFLCRFAIMQMRVSSSHLKYDKFWGGLCDHKG